MDGSLDAGKRGQRGQTGDEAPEEPGQQGEDAVESAVEDADDRGYDAAINLRHAPGDLGDKHRNHFFLEDR